MKFSDNGRKLLAKWEGLSTTVYMDSGGVPTIGVGHALSVSERRSGKIAIGSVIGDFREGLTIEQCHELLAQDIVWAERTVNFYVHAPLTQNQFDALVSFVFNVGREAFAESTLLKLLNASEYDKVPEQLARWCWDNGEKITGLIRRRERESELWNTPQSRQDAS